MKSSKVSLFLMELIIAILFFALASAVCIQLFVKSHLLGNTTIRENHALLMCQNLSEIYLGLLPDHVKEDPGALKDAMVSLIKEDPTLSGSYLELSVEQTNVLYNMLPSSVLSSDPAQDDTSVPASDPIFRIFLCFDKDRKPCSMGNAEYLFLFSYLGYQEEADVYEASVWAYDVSDSGSYKPIYHINVCKHIAERMP